MNISGTDRTRGCCQKSAADCHDAGGNKTSSHLLISLIVRTFLQLNEMPRGWKRRREQLQRAIRHLAVAIRDQSRHERLRLGEVSGARTAGRATARHRLAEVTSLLAPGDRSR
ncbi:hypothetical protein [Streptomyces sp. NBC_00154]|uniref:hypothetical protein n=1 Tax=Streptomyces sp. NBC_00154 TaxID=2975670 RepID=UPI0022539FB5|nr:hypothetical protein [Streptomyces sp. NBC_00154]MCX5317367.1 hypothetical protein [Streptomyces sp. NBC_00154]